MSTSVSKNTVRVRFNFALTNPKYNFDKALTLAKEEKSYLPFERQLRIDLSMADAIFNAGSVHEIPESLYKELSERKVETYNPLFGNFQGDSVKMTKRLKVPYVVRVSADNKRIDHIDQRLDLYGEKED